MTIALAMAGRGLGQAAPNPSVGAVIVDPATQEILARGWTQPGGRPHAETVAIEKAGARAHGATLYVTLEPCSHHGRTPPCADAIVAAGLSRVVIGIEDPDPRVAGRGVERLRAAGIDVVRFVSADACHWVTRGHILRVTERRPLVQLKMALDASGSIARGGDGRPVWVTGPEARMDGHRLRAMSDAILVGRQTVLDDDPELTCRIPGAAHRSPRRVVLARNLDVPVTARLVAGAKLVPTMIFCGGTSDAAHRNALADAGVEVLSVTEVAGSLWLPAVMEALVAKGVTRLLVEGGPKVWRSFVDAALADEVFAYCAGHAPPPWHVFASRMLGPACAEFEVISMRPVGADTVIHARRQRHAAGLADPAI